MRGVKLAMAVAIGLSVASGAQAALTLTGNYMQVGISDFGTFGSNGNTPPGIKHDPSGTATYGSPDYLTPGTPHDGFAINSVQTGFQVNDNAGGSPFGTSAPALTTVAGYAFAATWSGSLFGQIAVTNTYFFNPNDQLVNVRTELTALADLTNLAFGRSVDPDPDVNLHGTFATVNSRGNSTFGSSELVTSAGAVSGAVLGILNRNGNTYAHDTGISSFCCSNDDPYNVLAGYGPVFALTNTGDFGLQMAWNIGNLLTGQTATIDYAYVVGESRDTVGGIPEPTSMALIGAGLVGLGVIRRRRMR